MMRTLAAVKDRLGKVYEYIVELERMPVRLWQGEDYEEEKKPAVRVNRKNKVRVEDLRPSKPE